MTTDEQSIARNIVDQWFWQPAEGHNYHYRGALRTLVRFYESAPMEPDVMRLVIEYLRDEEVDGGISLMNRTVDLGSGWKAMDAWYRTDETEKWNGTDSRKVRVYQVLIQKPAAGDAVDGPYEVEKGCRYKVTHTFSWNVETLPTVPASSSGVNYALEAVVRDQESGLYSCVLTKRERLQQDVSEYMAARTLYQDTKEEQHLGVKQGQSAGKPASVSNGTVVERSVTKNEDCTVDVRNVTKVDKPVSDAVVTKEETLFESRTTTENRNQPSAAPMNLAPGASARDEKTQSNLHNQTVTTVEEKPVSDAVVEYARTLHGTQKSVTHRNQAQPVSENGMKIGERRTTRKTNGGKSDNTIVTQDVEPAGNVARSDRKTVFESSASVRENVAANGVLPERAAHEAGGGKTQSVDVQLHDDGTADIVTNDTTEKAVPGARRTKRKTLRGVVETTTDRNVADGSVDVTNIGDTVDVEITPGGRFNRTVTKIQKTPAGEIASGCEQTIFEHRHHKTTNVAQNPGGEGEEAGNGKTTRKEVRATDENSFDVTTTTTTEKPVKDAEVTKSKTLHGIRTRKLSRNQREPSVPEPENVGDTITTRKTEGGSVDVLEEKFTAKPAGKTASMNEESRHVRTSEIVTNKQAPEPTDVSYGDGKIVHKSSRLLDDSTADVSERTSTAKPSVTKRTWSDAYGIYTRCTYRNQAEPLLPNKSGDYIRTSATFQMNDFGLFDGVYTISDASKSDGGGRGREPSNFTKTVRVKEERILSDTRNGTSKVEWYQERYWRKVMRYNDNTGWYLDAMNDITSNPGEGTHLSRITGTYTWEYWFEPGDWSNVTRRTIG